MLKRLDPVTFVGIMILAIPFIAAGIVSCTGAGQHSTVDDPGARTLSVGHTTLEEVHPKPGVTCFVYHGYGISCIKD
jgi:hypothetical protein